LLSTMGLREIADTPTFAVESGPLARCGIQRLVLRARSGVQGRFPEQ
jgi:hypothetical protein